MTEPSKPAIDSFYAHQRGRIYALDLQSSTQPAERQEPGIAVNFQELSAEDVGALAVAMDQPLQEIRDRLSQKRRCFVAWREAEIASYCWISLQQEYVGEMESILDIHPGEAYIWNCATLPRYRRQGLYTALLADIVNRLAEEGMQRIWIGADLENVPSHRAFQTTGFLPAANFVFFRIWRLYAFLTTALPQTPPHLLSAARRLFQVDRLPSLGPLSIGWRK